MRSDNLTRTSSFVLAADEGQPFWFLSTLTTTKVGSDHSRGQLSIVDHRVPPGFVPPPHLHYHSDEALLILDGQLDGFCGNHRWRAGARHRELTPAPAWRPPRWCVLRSASGRMPGSCSAPCSLTKLA